MSLSIYCRAPNGGELWPPWPERDRQRLQPDPRDTQRLLQSHHRETEGDEEENRAGDQDATHLPKGTEWWRYNRCVSQGEWTSIPIPLPPPPNSPLTLLLLVQIYDQTIEATLNQYYGGQWLLTAILHSDLIPHMSVYKLHVTENPNGCWRLASLTGWWWFIIGSLFILQQLSIVHKIYRQFLQQLSIVHCIQAMHPAL